MTVSSSGALVRMTASVCSADRLGGGEGEKAPVRGVRWSGRLGPDAQDAHKGEINDLLMVLDKLVHNKIAERLNRASDRLRTLPPPRKKKSPCSGRLAAVPPSSLPPRTISANK